MEITNCDIQSDGKMARRAGLRGKIAQIRLSEFHCRRPYAFTEQGVAMLSSVLKSKRAAQVNIAIMRARLDRRLHAMLKEGGPTMANLDWSQCPAVESIPGKVSGAWVFRGTRMPVQTVFENLEAGMSVDEITEVFDVTPEEVKSALRFASESLAKAPSFG